jgi:hypothetical protein
MPFTVQPLRNYKQDVRLPSNAGLISRKLQKVRLQILPVSVDEVDQAIQTLVEAGLLTPPVGHSEVEPVLEEEQLRVAKILGQAAAKKPLSEMIIEDRGE